MKKKKLFSLFFLPLYLTLLALTAELLLDWGHKDPQPGPGAAFNVQYLHPYYYFSFPTNPTILQKINTNTISVDSRGYRGPGPEHKGVRDLAFVMGASTAFGHGSSDNEHIISADLNRLQKKFFFVTAATPSWNSFQELLRALKQTLPEKPKLIIHVNGVNDIATIYDRRQAPEIPADAPESYEILNQWVEDIRSPLMRRDHLLRGLQEHYLIRAFRFQHLRDLFGKNDVHKAHVTPKKNTPAPSQDSSLEDMADRAAALYIQNMDLIDEICRNRGIQFKVFFQPLLYTNPSIDGVVRDDSLWTKELMDLYKLYHRRVMEHRRPYLTDLSHQFSAENKETIDTLFVDSVHLTDLGYQKVSENILRQIQL